jgi:hypothetical protein
MTANIHDGSSFTHFNLFGTIKKESSKITKILAAADNDLKFIHANISKQISDASQVDSFIEEVKQILNNLATLEQTPRVARRMALAYMCLLYLVIFLDQIDPKLELYFDQFLDFAKNFKRYHLVSLVIMVSKWEKLGYSSKASSCLEEILNYDWETTDPDVRALILSHLTTRSY